MKIETTKFALYLFGIGLVVLSKLTNILTYNTAMMFAAFALSLSLYLDAFLSFRKDKLVGLILYALLATFILGLIAYLFLEVL